MFETDIRTLKELTRLNCMHANRAKGAEKIKVIKHNYCREWFRVD